MARNTAGIAGLPHEVAQSAATIGARIALARKRREWTQQDFADRMFVTRQTVAQLEKGNPAVSMGLYLLAAWLLDESFLQPFMASEQDKKGHILDCYKAENKTRIR